MRANEADDVTEAEAEAGGRSGHTALPASEMDAEVMSRGTQVASTGRGRRGKDCPLWSAEGHSPSATLISDQGDHLGRLTSRIASHYAALL